jgi:hypothetical protein
MPRSASDRAPAVWLMVMVVFGAALAFWWIQNHWHPVGGEIALQKALWLADAILLWLVVPLMVVTDARAGVAVRSAFMALLMLMLVRGAIELWMLYVTHNWSPWYGIAHDVLCAGTLLWFMFRIAISAHPLQRLRLWLAHLGATAAAFAPEIYFAWYMQAHFNTRGGQAVYFVPDDPAHAFTLNVTTGAVVCFSAWIFIFLYRWLHGAPDGQRTGA